MCESDGSEDIIDSKSQYNPKDIILRPTVFFDNYYVLIIDREKNKIRFFYRMSQSIELFENQNECIDWCKTRLQIKNKTCDESEKSYCFVPNFVKQIDSNLLKQIDGITDVNNISTQRVGHLILFNIDGKPKFCFIEFGKDLSNDVIIK